MYTYQSYANVPFMGVLPYGETNFGGDTQGFVIPEEYFAGGQPYLRLNPIAQDMFNRTPSYVQGYQTPTFDQGNLNNLADSFLAPGMNRIISSKINTCLNNISVTKQRLNSMLQKEGITDDEKTEINKLLDELNEQEKQLKELTEATETTPKDAYAKAEEIEQAVRGIITKVGNIGKPNSTEETDSSTESEETSETDSTEQTDSTQTGSSQTTQTEETQGSTGALNYSSNVKAGIEQFYQAINGMGTDDESMEAVINTIDDKNVMDYMTAWNKYHSQENGESFMQAFMDDANEGFWGNALTLGICHLFGYGAKSDQKVNSCRRIELALREKAEQLGVYDACSQDFAAIDKELSSVMLIDKSIYKHYDNIIKVIANKMGKGYEKYGSPNPTVGASEE